MTNKATNYEGRRALARESGRLSPASWQPVAVTPWRWPVYPGATGTDFLALLP